MVLQQFPVAHQYPAAPHPADDPFFVFIGDAVHLGEQVAFPLDNLVKGGSYRDFGFGQHRAGF